MPRASLVPVLLALCCLAAAPAACRHAESASTSGAAVAAQPDPAPAETPGSGDAQPTESTWPTIVLNGEITQVRWSDGDSFKFKSGPWEGKGVRLKGYNTLESYGPVHRWGTWTPDELYRIAKSSWKLGAAQRWECSTDESQDHYGRLLVSCPGAALSLVNEGHAVVFALDEEPAAGLLEAQRAAMAAGKGMWAKGAPDSVITSLHSMDEGDGDKASVYNRVVDTHTGLAAEASHSETYATCQEVCHGDGETGSCMVYVPFSNRYRNKPECIGRRSASEAHGDDGAGSEAGE